MAKTYSAQDWYWIVGSDTNQVYSSLSFGYVPTNNATYVAFLADDNLPTLIPTEADLRVVLNNAGVAFMTEPVSPLEEDRPRIVRARVRLIATSFSITSGTPRSIPWTSAQVDPLGMWSASPNPERVLILQPGSYRFTLGVRFSEGTRTGTRALQLALGLGGSPTDLGTMRLAPALAGDTSFGFTEYAPSLSVSNVLRAFVEQGSGSNMNAVARLTLVREE